MIKREPYIGMPIILGEYDGMELEAEPTVTVQMPANNSCCSSCNGDNGNVDRRDIDNLPLAMAYVPLQRWERVYDYERGLKEGTVFPDLNLPFKGYQGGRGR